MTAGDSEEPWDAEGRGSRFPRPCSGCGLTLQNEADRARHLNAMAQKLGPSRAAKVARALALIKRARSLLDTQRGT